MQYYLFYLLATFIGAIIAYCIGMQFKEVILKILDFPFSVFTKDQTFSSIIAQYDPLNVLVTKSFLPSIPISVINIACGIKNNNFLKFLLYTLICRTIRFLFIYLSKNLLKFNIINYFVSTIIYSTTIIYMTAISIFMIYYVFSLPVFNIYAFS